MRDSLKKKRVWAMTPARRKALDARMARTLAKNAAAKTGQPENGSLRRRKSVSPVYRLKDPLVVLTGSKGGIPQHKRVVGISLIFE